MKLVQGTESEPSAKFLVMGTPGSGKTPFVTALPWGSPRWGEKAVYVAFDHKERELQGVLSVNRPHLIRPEYRGVADPYSFAMEVLDYPWEKDGARTIILDTMTNLSRDIRTAVTQASHYSGKIIESGSQTFKMSDKPHYGLAHTMVGNVINKIKGHHLNVIAVFWADWKEPQDGEPGGTFGGPLTVNMTYSKDIAGEFPNILYLRTEYANGKTRYLLHTEQFGFWTARLHGLVPNPIPVLELGLDPSKAWLAIDKAQGVKEVLTTTTTH